jgi:hypothetical protein
LLVNTSMKVALMICFCRIDHAGEPAEKQLRGVDEHERLTPNRELTDRLSSRRTPLSTNTYVSCRRSRRMISAATVESTPPPAHTPPVVDLLAVAPSLFDKRRLSSRHAAADEREAA